MENEKALEVLRAVIKEMIEEAMVSERGLGFPEKTLTPRSDGENLPYHAPVTTNLPHPNRKSRFRKGRAKKKK